MKFRFQHIHFVGIGGIGMSGIAEVLRAEGYWVSGSDAERSATIDRLIGLGVTFTLGHNASNIGEAQAVVVSSAINARNPELVEAKKRGIPIVKRAEMLAQLMRMKYGIAIAGTHGKTTTTSLVASVLDRAKLRPTFVIGGRLLSIGTNAGLGKGELLVAEADESDASFLQLLPTLAVITNIDADHMETYKHDVKRLHNAFTKFANLVPFYGSLYVCVDDEGVAAILPKLQKRPCVTYGTSEKADVRATKVTATGTSMQFTVIRQNFKPLSVNLMLAGEHNVRNALAAIAIAQDLRVPWKNDVRAVSDKTILDALANFKGVGRRFQQYGNVIHQGKEFELIDDYGHHPVELKATLAAARGAFPSRRLVLVFQPHRFTRTRDLLENFADVLADVDALVLTEVYAAGEARLENGDGRSLARAIRLRGRVEPLFVEDIAQLPDSVLQIVRDGDVVMTMGAGSIGTTAQKIVSASSGGAHVV